MNKAYPWDKWFAAIEWPDDVLDLEVVTDFTCSPDSLVRQFKRQAASRGIDIVVSAYKPRNFSYAVRVMRKFRHDDYPWETWLDGHERVLVGGVDYFRSVTSMQAQVHGAALRRGQKVSTSTIAQSNMLRVQALTPPRPPRHERFAAALALIEPGTELSLSKVEGHLKEHGEEPLQGRAMTAVLQQLGWGRRRTSKGRYWIAPQPNSDDA